MINSQGQKIKELGRGKPNRLGGEIRGKIGKCPLRFLVYLFSLKKVKIIEKYFSSYFAKT